MTIQEIVSEIHEKYPGINNVYYVGCGASQSDLYPSKYFLAKNARKIRTEVITANEFYYDPPVTVGEESIIITCSLGGNTPETVAAAKKAREIGAPVICLTNKEDSPLAANADYPIVHGFFESYSAKMEKLTKCLELTAEILNQYEHYEHYEELLEGCRQIYRCIDNAIPFVKPFAEEFGNKYKNFHGPFELVEKDKPYLLLVNDGPTRQMDLRALTFLKRFDAKVTVVDAKDYGLDKYVSASVKEYFNPILIDGILRLYGESIAEKRQHPLTMRRYMWKLEY